MYKTNNNVDALSYFSANFYTYKKIHSTFALIKIQCETCYYYKSFNLKRFDMYDIKI